MFLNGSLENFSVADILQLLSFSRQSGALYVQGAVDAVLYLEDGEAYFARRDSDSPLGDILFAHGVDESDWSGAVAESASRDAVGETLVMRGAIDGDLLAYVVHRQLTDTLFDLFRMPRRGTFDFRVGERHEIGPVKRYKIDALIDDTRRRVEEWATISEFISSPSAMVSVATELPAESVELTLDRRQWDLLLLAAREDRSTLTEMAQRLDRTDAEVAASLDGLIRAGLVTILEMQAPAFEGDASPQETHEPASELHDSTPSEEVTWAPQEAAQDPVSHWEEAEELEGEPSPKAPDTRAEAGEQAPLSEDPLSPDWFQTEIGSWEDPAPPADDGEEIESWESPLRGVGDEIDDGQGTPSESMEDEIASWEEAAPLFEDAGPRVAGDGPEEAGSWWPGTPDETSAATEWEATWGPRDADEDEPEWFGTSEETAPAAEEDLGGSIWGEAAEEASDDAGTVWHTPEGGDSDSRWTPDDQPIWAKPGDSSEAFAEPPAPAAEGPEVPPAPPAAEAPPAPTADPAEGPPAPDSGDPVTSESSEGESSGFRTVALQELRNLAGVAGTPVRLPGSARRPADEGGSAPSSPAPKIRALKRLIAAVRGL